MADERIQRGTAGFMFIKGTMMNRSSWTFTHFVLRDDSLYSGSGFGQKGEGRSVQVLTLR